MQYRINSTRLSCWDYCNEGWYFVTLCTHEHQKYFGEIINDQICYNLLGNKCDEYWNEIPLHYRAVELDYYIIMPNHIHGIIIMNNDNQYSLGNIVGGFKSALSKWAHQNKNDDFRWQSRFYEHIIKNEKDLDRIRKYIIENPLKWNIDEYRV